MEQRTFPDPVCPYECGERELEINSCSRFYVLKLGEYGVSYVMFERLARLEFIERIDKRDDFVMFRHSCPTACPSVLQSPSPAFEKRQAEEHSRSSRQQHTCHGVVKTRNLAESFAGLLPREE